MPLTIHHLHVSQSERIPWLLALSEALHPAGAAPVVQDGDKTLAESCAVIEYICHRYGGGGLFLKPDHAAYPDFLYWWHWADGTFMGSLSRGLTARSAGLSDDNVMVKLSHERFVKALAMLDERLEANEWLAGGEFTVADIMVVFMLTTFRHFFAFSLRGYEGILRYLQRIGSREAYRRAIRTCDPEMELALGPGSPKPFLST